MRSLKAILLLIAVLILEGCDANVFGFGKRVDYTSFVLDAMRQKYGEAFTYKGPCDMGFNRTWSIFASSESLPEANALVTLDVLEKNTYDVRDNYLSVKYQGDVEALVQACAGEVFEQALVYSRVPQRTISPDIPADIGLEDYLRARALPLHLTVQVPASGLTSAEPAERLAERINELGADYYLTVVALGPEMETGLDYGDVQNRLSNNAYARCAHISNVGGSFRSRWEEGKLSE